jgi:hypothetical protein
MYLRQNATQEFIGDMRDASQPTISRYVATLVPLVKSALKEFTPSVADAIEGTYNAKSARRLTALTGIVHTQCRVQCMIAAVAAKPLRSEVLTGCAAGMGSSHADLGAR